MAVATARELVQVPLAQIKIAPQPRSLFDDAETEALAESLKEFGLQQPIVVRQVNGHYELVAGERRVRAARLLAWKHIDAVLDTGLADAPPAQILKLQIVENAQRVHLHVLDEARSYVRLYREEGLGPTEIARLVGKDQSTVSNTIRWFEQATARMHDLIAQGWEPSKAVTLLPLVHANPELADRIAEIAFENDVPKSKLAGLPFSEQLQREGLVRLLPEHASHLPQEIDHPKVCEGCPAYLRFETTYTQYGGSEYKRTNFWCLRAKTGYPTQVAAKQAEIAAKRAETLADLDEAQRAALAAQAAAATARHEQATREAQAAEEKRLGERDAEWRAQIAGLDDTDLLSRIAREGTLQARYQELCREEATKRNLEFTPPAAPVVVDDDMEPEEVLAEIEAAEEEEAAAAVGDAGAAVGVLVVGEGPLKTRYVDSREVWTTLEYKHLPPGCTEACPCRAKALDPRTGGFVDICLQPGRMQSLASQATRQENKEKRAKLAAAKTALCELAGKATEDGTAARRFLATWCAEKLDKARKPDLALAFAAVGVDWPEYLFSADSGFHWPKTEDCWNWLTEQDPRVLAAVAGLLDGLASMQASEYQKTWFVAREIRWQIGQEIEEPHGSGSDAQAEETNRCLEKLGRTFRVEGWDAKQRKQRAARLAARAAGEPVPEPEIGEDAPDLPSACSNCGADLEYDLAAEMVDALETHTDVPYVGDKWADRVGIMTGHYVHYCGPCTAGEGPQPLPQICANCGYSIHANTEGEEERTFIGDLCSDCHKPGGGEEPADDDTPTPAELARYGDHPTLDADPLAEGAFAAPAGDLVQIAVPASPSGEVGPAAVQADAKDWKGQPLPAAPPAAVDYPSEELLATDGLEGVEVVPPLVANTWKGAPKDAFAGDLVEWLGDCIPGKEIALVQFPGCWTARWTGRLLTDFPTTGRQREAVSVEVLSPERVAGDTYNVAGKELRSLRPLWKEGQWKKDRVNGLTCSLVAPGEPDKFGETWTATVIEPGDWHGKQPGDLITICKEPDRWRPLVSQPDPPADLDDAGPMEGGGAESLSECCPFHRAGGDPDAKCRYPLAADAGPDPGSPEMLAGMAEELERRLEEQPDDPTMMQLRIAQKMAGETGEAVVVLPFGPHHSLTIQPGGGMVFQSAQPATRGKRDKTGARREKVQEEPVRQVPWVVGKWVAWEIGAEHYEGEIVSILAAHLSVLVGIAPQRPDYLNTKRGVACEDPTLRYAERPEKPKLEVVAGGELDAVNARNEALLAGLGELRPNVRLEWENEGKVHLASVQHPWDGRVLRVVVDHVDGERLGTAFFVEFRAGVIWPVSLRRHS
jgi:ParB/RepB/Spo0J family partition protein